MAGPWWVPVRAGSTRGRAVPKIDVEALIKPVSAEAPCGVDLKSAATYPRFNEVIRLAEGPDLPPVETGEVIAEPSWREVFDGCVELLMLGRHLEIGVWLALSSTRLDGYKGLEASLRVMRTWVEQQWEQVYPKLDPEDPDPVERMNLLNNMVAPMATYGDKLRFLERVREAPLVENRTVGRFSLKDLALASGEQQPGPDGRRPEMGLVEAAFKTAEPEHLAEMAGLLEACIGHCQGLVGAFNAKVKPGDRIDLTSLEKLLGDGLRHIKRFMGQPVEGAGEAAGGGSGGGGGTGGAMVSRGGAGALAGEVGGEADVRVALDKVFQYYATHEPSSPVGLAVACAKNLIGRDFLAISEVLTPDAVATLRRIRDWNGEASS